MAIADINTTQLSRKRSFHHAFDSELDREAESKCQRPGSLVLNWLQSLPPVRSLRNIPCLVLQQPLGTISPPCRSETIDDMSEDPSKSQRSASTGIIKTQSYEYSSVLEGNGVILDPTNKELRKNHDLRIFIQNTILRRRNSPPLDQETLEDNVERMAKAASGTEAIVTEFVSSDLFPVNRELARGGNSPWPTVALPRNPDYPQGIAAPKPDYHIGYASKRNFTPLELGLVTHPFTKTYMQPGKGTILPFLVVELKSAATGGNLRHAEHQAAGSGTASVANVMWVFEQAGLTATPLESLAFSVQTDSRYTAFCAHWYSPTDKVFYMSEFESASLRSTVGVQRCHDIVKNIAQWGTSTRQLRIKEALKTFKIPDGPILDVQSNTTESQGPAYEEEDNNDRDIVQASQLRSARASSAKSSHSRGRRTSRSLTSSFTSGMSVSKAPKAKKSSFRSRH
ncbi:MAG: hypothetical protein GOMPHAMPRED_002447 [Gomphillus americanus]|uniref:DUF7924 domain-containing protein n=1 Tax=Gomphillus americanus TaxID=1940652 RepID=A0A8H3FCB7_9LECA|nr:MAG: hypothetical protein GOMPHAMPRED_002447 [Gomphillus americanus]